MDAGARSEGPWGAQKHTVTRTCSLPRADRAAEFVAFYDRTMPGLLGFFARRTLDGQVAADLTAETLADAVASRRRFRDCGDGSASAWLHTIAYRKLGRFFSAVELRMRHGDGLAWSALSSQPRTSTESRL
jgi:DNA-directed RNA polymerase specialized sigma24 family protein